MDEQLLTFEEAAALLHSKISVSTLQRARREGRLWAVKIGSRYYTTCHAVMEFVQCPGPENPPACISAKMNSNRSSGTETPRNGLDMALASASRLKQHSLNT